MNVTRTTQKLRLNACVRKGQKDGETKVVTRSRKSTKGQGDK
jgi:hypothetical protein